jgi:pimeloyl-ACP methyl ester carboxylesterase
MRVIRNGGIKLATESFGAPDHPTLLLIMGATASMLGWPAEFCAELARQGFHVIRFDHRDTGQSTTVPPGEAAYAVEDLADDAVAILDGYGCARAHLVGMSLGGYVAQMLAVSHPARFGTLTLIGSEPLGWDGEPLPHISPAFLEHFGALGALDWSNHKAVAQFLLETARLCAGTLAAFDVERESARIERVVSRTDSIASMFNHGTITARTDWTGRFREIKCPTLVLHGAEDPILPIENGSAIADGILNASLIVLDKVGHEIPLPVISSITKQIVGHVIGARI